MEGAAAPVQFIMAGSTHKNKRIISVVAGTLVALACGTNVWESAYLYTS